MRQMERLSVAVVGGYEDEPEMQILRAHFENIDLQVLGISDSSDVFLDLNSSKWFVESRFDLVLCSQVIEHIWNHNTFFLHISKLTPSNALLWLAAPASNFEHGFPSYFSAGFSESYLSNNLTGNGFRVLSSGKIASRRSYLMRHIFLHWISAGQASAPVTFFVTNFFKLNWRLKVASLLTSLIPESSKSTYSVESFAFAVKI